jgi:beta-mannan synthase
MVDAAEQLMAPWQQLRGLVIVPLLRASVLICLTMSVMILAEKVYMAVVIVAVRLVSRRRYRWEPVRDTSDDPELGGAACPIVLVQIPMYNESKVNIVVVGRQWICMLV